ncbi:MAG: ABC transporter substrate-binding protein [Chloroflexi bacterium]|nr:ABC transporter substrate-binding protein [Chloroflexota bacterium]
MTAAAPTPTKAPAAAATPTPTRVIAVTPTPTPAPSIPTPTPKRVPKGILNTALENLGSESWVVRLTTGVEGPVTAHVFEPLVGYDTETGAYPPTGLAEKWSAEALPGGGSKWSFTLRKGIQFHGGQGELTSDDVRFSLAEFLKSGSLNPNAGLFQRWIGKDINNFKVLDKYSFEIHSPETLVTVLRRLSFGYQSSYFAPTSKKYAEAVGEEAATRRPVGTGPFEFADHKRNQKVTLKALTEHWRIVPSVAEVNIFIVPEASTRIAMLRTGATDLAPISVRYKGELEAARLKIFRGQMAMETFGAFGGMVLNTRPKYDPNQPWTQGPDPINEKARLVRQAMNLAIDRQALLNKIFLGEGFLSSVAFNFQKEGVAWWSPKWKPYLYDPKKAKELLAQGGYPNGFETGMWLIKLAAGPENVDASEAVASFWETNLGLKVNRMLTEDRPTVRQRRIERDTAGWTWLYTNPSVTDPPTYACSSGGPSFSTTLHSEHPKIDELCDKILNELDFGKQSELVRQLGDFWYDNYWHIPLVTGNILFAGGSRIRNYPISPGSSLMANLEYLTLVP